MFTFSSDFDIRQKVRIDGSDIVGYITKITFDRTYNNGIARNIVSYQVEWLSGGHNQSVSIDGWRLELV